MTLAEQVAKVWRNRSWLLAYGWARLVSKRVSTDRPMHLIIAVADHFEPANDPTGIQRYVDYSVQERRLAAWCREYPAIDQWRDSDGRPFRHTYFYPAEQYDKALIDRLAEHCHSGWGEIEIHLHHGYPRPDTSENSRCALREFRDVLVRHECLSRWDGEGPPRYAFVHGDWALANSGRGQCCGVDDEMQILAETGCYADVTLPSAPNIAQVSKINALYECALPLDRRAPHRRGHDLRRGRPPKTFPLMIQGPLLLNFGTRRVFGVPLPCIENGALTTRYPPTLERLELWSKAAITVKGYPHWRFIKLHCHGMDPRDTEALVGRQIRQFLQALTSQVGTSRGYRVHFVTVREMANIILAACDGADGNPGDYRDYRLKLIRDPVMPPLEAKRERTR